MALVYTSPRNLWSMESLSKNCLLAESWVGQIWSSSSSPGLSHWLGGACREWDFSVNAAMVPNLRRLDAVRPMYSSQNALLKDLSGVLHVYT